MKISPEDPILKVIKQDQKVGKESVTENSFKDILDGVSGAGTPRPADVRQPFSSQGISPIQTNSFPMVVNDLELRLEKFINRIEKYQKKLEDPNAGMKEIYAVLKKMEKEQAGLEKVNQGLDDGEVISDIVNQALVLSSMEVFKFNSGRYQDE